MGGEGEVEGTKEEAEKADEGDSIEACQSQEVDPCQAWREGGREGSTLR
jgi:hypothetical protein